MTKFHKANFYLLISIFGWFIIRLVILLFITPVYLFEPHNIAINMLQTGEMKYFLNNKMNYNYQFPVYPYLLFIIYKTFGIIPKLAIVLNCLFHSLATLVGYYVFTWFAENSKIQLVKKYATLIALLSTFGILFHPLINYYTLMIVHPFALNLLFMLLSLFCMIHYFKISGAKSFIFLGLVFGLTLLDRISLVILLVPFFTFLLLNNSLRFALKKSFILFLFGILVLSPWLYRNYTIYHKLSITSSLGQNLWLGIQEETGGTSNLQNGNSYYNLLTTDDWKKINTFNSEEESDYFIEKYKHAISNSPMLFVKMYFIKLKTFWWFRTGIGDQYTPTIKKWIPLYRWFYAIVLFLSIYYVFKNKKEALVISSIPVALSLFSALFYVETRHRVIIEPILLFMCVCSLFIICSEYIRRKYASAVLQK